MNLYHSAQTYRLIFWGKSWKFNIFIYQNAIRFLLIISYLLGKSYFCLHNFSLTHIFSPYEEIVLCDFFLPTDILGLKLKIEIIQTTHNSFIWNINKTLNASLVIMSALHFPTSKHSKATYFFCLKLLIFK